MGNQISDGRPTSLTVGEWLRSSSSGSDIGFRFPTKFVPKSVFSSEKKALLQSHAKERWFEIWNHGICVDEIVFRKQWLPNPDVKAKVQQYALYYFQYPKNLGVVEWNRLLQCCFDFQLNDEVTAGLEIAQQLCQDREHPLILCIR
jgi:hypothetical protein